MKVSRLCADTDLGTMAEKESCAVAVKILLLIYRQTTRNRRAAAVSPSLRNFPLGFESAGGSAPPAAIFA